MAENLDFATIGKRLKAIRTAQGYTQTDIADRIGCDTSHISNVENNHTKVSLSMLVNMCNALHTTVDYVLREEYLAADDAMDQAILSELRECPYPVKEATYQILKVLKSQGASDRPVPDAQKKKR